MEVEAKMAKHQSETNTERIGGSRIPWPRQLSINPRLTKRGQETTGCSGQGSLVSVGYGEDRRQQTA